MKFIKKILKIIVIFISLLITILLIAFIIDKQSTNYLNIKNKQSNTSNSYVITNVNVVPMTQDTVLKNKTVFIKNGIIESIINTIKPESDNIINGEGMYLLPGLIDMHVHVWDKQELGLYLSNGVTTIRNVWGMPFHLKLKKEIENNKIISPQFFTTGPKLTGPEFIGDDNLQIFSPDEGKEKVKLYKKQGYDFLKTYYGLPKDIFDAIIDQAKTSNMDIVAHPSQKVPYSYHFNSQISSIEHAEDIVQQPLNYKLDSIKLKEVIHEFKKSPQTSFCPTLTVYHNILNMLKNEQILSSEKVKFMNPVIKMIDSKNEFNRWDSTKKIDSAIVNNINAQHNFHLYIINKLNEANVNIIAGTDSGIGITAPGFSIHEELNFYKKAGLSNFEVLKTATVNPSKSHKIMHNIGTIESGKIANLILLKNNPLTDLNTLKDPEIVFIKGKKLKRNLLKTFKKKAYNRHNYILTLYNYVENMISTK